MKKNLTFLFYCTICVFLTFPAVAQMFYNAGSSFDSTGSTSSSATSFSVSESDPNQKEAPFEKIVSKEIRERIRADAAYIIGEPDEALCYGIARKSPKKRSATIDGYAHTGNCGALNSVGMTEVQKQLFNSASYDMNVTKIASCVTTPRLVLRFRKGFDFVDVILSGGHCPAVVFMYGGDTKEFSAKPIKEWLDTFIEAVSNDLEPVETEEAQKQAASIFRKRTPEEETAQKEPEKPAAPIFWGRRAPKPEQPEDLPPSDPNVPPPPK